MSDDYLEKLEACAKRGYKNQEERDEFKRMVVAPDMMFGDRHSVLFSAPSETGTSYFRIFEPLRAIIKHFPEEFNILYSEGGGGLNANHLKACDLAVLHRCGNNHNHFLDILKVYPKTEKRPYVVNDMDDNEYNLPMIEIGALCGNT